MSRGELYAAYDAVISLESSGNFAEACRIMKCINKQNKRTRR